NPQRGTTPRPGRPDAHTPAPRRCYWSVVVRVQPEELSPSLPRTSARRARSSRRGLKTVEELETGEAELRAAIASLEETRGYLEAECDRIGKKADALDERMGETRRRLETEEGLRAWLTEIGEERLEAGLDALGWLEEAS